MPKIDFEVPHSLGREEAHRRLEALVDSMGQQYSDHVTDLHQEWENSTLSFSFKTFSMQIRGLIDVTDDAARVDCEIPLSAMLFKGRIVSEVSEHLKRLLQ